MNARAWSHDVFHAFCTSSVGGGSIAISTVGLHEARLTQDEAIDDRNHYGSTLLAEKKHKHAQSLPSVLPNACDSSPGVSYHHTQHTSTRTHRTHRVVGLASTQSHELGSSAAPCAHLSSNGSPGDTRATKVLEEIVARRQRRSGKVQGEISARERWEGGRDEMEIENVRAERESEREKERERGRERSMQEEKQREAAEGLEQESMTLTLLRKEFGSLADPLRAREFGSRADPLADSLARSLSERAARESEIMSEREAREREMRRREEKVGERKLEGDGRENKVKPNEAKARAQEEAEVPVSFQRGRDAGILPQGHEKKNSDDWSVPWRADPGHTCTISDSRIGAGPAQSNHETPSKKNCLLARLAVLGAGGAGSPKAKDRKFSSSSFSVEGEGSMGFHNGRREEGWGGWGDEGRGGGAGTKNSYSSADVARSRLCDTYATDMYTRQMQRIETSLHAITQPCQGSLHECAEGSGRSSSRDHVEELLADRDQTWRVVDFVNVRTHFSVTPSAQQKIQRVVKTSSNQMASPDTVSSSNGSSLFESFPAHAQTHRLKTPPAGGVLKTSTGSPDECSSLGSPRFGLGHIRNDGVQSILEREAEWGAQGENQERMAWLGHSRRRKGSAGVREWGWAGGGGCVGAGVLSVMLNLVLVFWLLLIDEGVGCRDGV